jgi:acetyltransferase-like isoleucine patch superfamily enzyme
MEIDKSLLMRQRLSQARSFPLKGYMELTVGRVGFWRFLEYELLTSVVGSMAGASGYLMRRMLYPRLFRRCGHRPIFGRDVVIRYPRNIDVGDNVTIDDYALLDGRGAVPAGIVIEDNVVVNRNCMLKAKAGPIRLGRDTNLGGNSVIVSLAGIDIGQSVLVAGGCYINAGAYPTDGLSRPMMDRGAYSEGPITIGDDVWIGTGAIILDGVTIGPHAVISAGAVVARDIPEGAIAAGIPARPIWHRPEQKAPH